jgi:hypothetical protein
MTRIATMLVCLVFLAAVGVGQNPPEQTGRDSHMAQESQNCDMMGTHDRHDARGMHEQMMKDMQSDLDGMRSNLQKMKDQIGKVENRGMRDQLQLNIDMWQSMIDHMDKDMGMMKKMMGPRESGRRDVDKLDHEHAPATPQP